MITYIYHDYFFDITFVLVYFSYSFLSSCDFDVILLMFEAPDECRERMIGSPEYVAFAAPEVCRLIFSLT